MRARKVAFEGCIDVYKSSVRMGSHGGTSGLGVTIRDANCGEEAAEADPSWSSCHSGVQPVSGRMPEEPGQCRPHVMNADAGTQEACGVAEWTTRG